MKRFLLFYGDIYYPDGGMSDFVNDFDDLNEAIEAAKQKAVAESKVRSFRPFETTWANVWDCELRAEVWDSLTYKKNLISEA